MLMTKVVQFDKLLTERRITTGYCGDTTEGTLGNQQMFGVGMENDSKEVPRRVLIASANPLFGKGLWNLLQQQWGQAASVVGLTTTMEQTLRALDELLPDLVIVDFDDRTMNRADFLNHFVSDERPMQVALVSLQSNGGVVVYNRRRLTLTQAENWLSESWLSDLFGN